MGFENTGKLSSSVGEKCLHMCLRGEPKAIMGEGELSLEYHSPHTCVTSCSKLSRTLIKSGDNPVSTCFGVPGL